MRTPIRRATRRRIITDERVACNRVLVYRGTISYPVYPIHPTVIYALCPLHFNEDVAAALAITLGYATLTCYRFERFLILASIRRTTRSATRCAVTLE